MRRTLSLALVAAALSLTAAACAAPSPTESRRPDVRRDEDPTPPPTDSTKKCGGMIGSGTFVC
ncbi:MAG TPA: hypothetical protein VFJ16_12810 [Longimicrobium sp.]|nr:hypothetical protein [Longimicrobium sp.]